MKILQPQEEKIKLAIRDAIAVDPLISISRLQDVLFKKGFKTVGNQNLAWHYIAKVVRKINREAIERVDRQQITERLAQSKERYRLVFDRLMRIAFYTDDLKQEGMLPPSYKDQISALNSIVRLDIAILNAEMDAGIFERYLGTLEIDKRNKPIPKEVRDRIKQAMINWGMMPEEIIKQNADDAKPTTALVVRNQQSL